ncbi:hypothetical protein QTP70_008287 [Hemibagrus guttatus]|uniref:Amidohydrolase-related domain-containing protein n=1 Tax=Hemibagrus guttatus TaxID=175788 RepID=A0AAE0RKV1_9TELE|nr:hypothetical protein QTP70_008287 [Hemibagrus guttatus]
MEAGSTVSAVRSTKVLIGDEVRPALITIKDGKIHNILPDPGASAHDGGEVLDVGDSVVMPGLVDCHVHVNEPGRTIWEGYWTATQAAAAGGVTTIVDMPLNSIPPTTSLMNFHEKLQAATGQCFVDTAFWGGVVPGNQLELRPMVQAGVAGFKCFLIHSGVDEFPHFHAEQEVHPPPAENGGLPLFWTSAHKRGFAFPDVVKLLCKEPARLCRLDNQKGSLMPGHDADLVIWDPEKEFTVKEENIHHKNKLTPYLGLTLCGEVKGTIVRGKLVYFNGSFSPQPLGQSLLINQTLNLASL